MIFGTIVERDGMLFGALRSVLESSDFYLFPKDNPFSYYLSVVLMHAFYHVYMREF